MGVSTSKLMLFGAGGAATYWMMSMWKVEKAKMAKEKKEEEMLSNPILGLENSGNTCFLNAILQALASCKYMKEWLRQKDADCNENLAKPPEILPSFYGVSYPLIAAMFRGMLVLNRELEVEDSSYAVKVPSDILAGLRFHGHRIGIQQEQDAYEVFLLIAMALNQEVEHSFRRKQRGSVATLTDGLVQKRELLPLAHGADEDVNDDWAVIEPPNDFRITDQIYSKRQLEMKWDYKKSPNNPFRCVLFTQMQCLVCMSKSNVRMESMDSISLTLPPLVESEEKKTLSFNDLIRKYMRPTLVHNVDCETCTNRARALAVAEHVTMAPSFKIKSTFSKYNFIGKLPNCLCIHFPRCAWSELGMTKRSEYITFTERVNFALLQRLYDDARTPENGILAKSIDELNEGSLRRFRNSEYCLMAVVSHFGSDADTGHFVTFRRVVSRMYPNISMWYFVSDEDVKIIPFSAVAATKAYMLFYEKTHVKE